MSDDPRIDYPSTHEFSLANLYRNISILQYVNIQFFDPKVIAGEASPSNNDFSQVNLYRNISIFKYVNIQFFDPKYALRQQVRVTMISVKRIYIEISRYYNM